jgi:transcriptional regulator with XRE-family HTH domain
MSNSDENSDYTAKAHDAHVGQRIRQRRQLLNLSIDQLATRIGLAPQQMLTYETGTVRIGAVTLYKISRALDIYLDWFFTNDNGTALQSRTGDGTQDFLELSEQFSRITDPAARERVITFASEVAADQQVLQPRRLNNLLN